MVSKKSNSYYISDTFLNLWIFKYTPNNEIIYELFNNKNDKIYSGKLADECREDFIVNIGEQNDIHIVVRKISGDIIYYFFNGKKWNIQILYNLNQHKDSFRLLSLHLWINQVHIIYGIQGTSNTRSWIWVDQHWEDKTWKHNKLFQAEVKNNNLQYVSTQDNSGNIYCISQWWDGIDKQIEYFQFHSNINLWNKNNLTFKKGDKYAPNIWLTEENQRIHTCWISKNDEKYILNYRNKDISFTKKSQWGKEQEIYSSINKISKPFFAEISNVLTIYWIENNSLYYLQSKDLGDTWEVIHILLAKLSDPYIFNFIFKKTINNDKCSHIVFDYKNSQTYPISFITKVNYTTKTNFKNTFYPLPQSQASTIKSKSFNFADTSSIQKKSSISFDRIKTFDEKQNPLYVPTSYKDKNKTGKQIMKNRLKTRIVEDENIKLKSVITDYRNIVDKMQKDLKLLKKEINNIDHDNKVLQNKIYEIKENKLSKKFLNFFNGN